MDLTLVDIIKDYQILADNVVCIFKKKYQIEDIIEGWHSRLYNQTGSLEEEGIEFYAFHGIGLAVRFKDKFINFDLAFSSGYIHDRRDGFIFSNLFQFIKSQPDKYAYWNDENKAKIAFDELIAQGVILQPKQENSPVLYFLSHTL